MNAADIQLMTVAERLWIMETIWESLSLEDAEIASPDWHEDLLASRRERLDSGDAEFVRLEDLKATRR